MPFLGSSGRNLNIKGAGGSHPGVGPQDPPTTVSISTGSPLSTPINGLQLFINNATTVWSQYQNLPVSYTHLTLPTKA